MKQSYFTSPGFTFRLQPFGTTTALFLLFFLLNFSFGFGQEIPVYDWEKAEPMGQAGYNSLDQIVIATATDTEDNIYALKFGGEVLVFDNNGDPAGSFQLEGSFEGLVDMAINSKNELYVAHYEGREVLAFNLNGNELTNKRKDSDYFKPLGLAFNQADDLYILDYNDGTGGESEISSRLKIYYDNGAVSSDLLEDELDQPYRIAIANSGDIYISHAADNGETLVFDENFNFLQKMSNLGSPGSVEIDNAGFIYIIDYSDKVDFAKILEGDEFYLLSALGDINEGINENEFSIKIFNPDNSFERPLRDEIQLPLDLSFTYCTSKMAVDNTNISGFNLVFDLEIYNRTPSFDTEDPLAVCKSGLEFTLENGEVTITAEEIDGGSIDNCEIESLELSQYTFFEARDYEIELTVTDAAGNVDTCETTITILPGDEEEAPPEVACNDFEVFLNSYGEVSITAQEVYDGDENLELEIDKSNFTCEDIGENEVILTVTDSETELSNTCTAIITVTDDQNPIVSCVAGGKEFQLEDGSVTISVSDIEVSSSDNCSISTKSLSETTFTTSGTKSITLTVEDVDGNIGECSTTIEILAEPQPPEIDCTDLDIFLDENGQISLEPEEIYNGDRDDLELSLNKEDFNCTNLGENTVTLTAIDPDTQLSSTCTAKVTVLDQIDPDINCIAPGSEFRLVEGSVTISAEQIDDNSTDNCAIVSRIISEDTFTTTGTKNITLTVEDQSGNRAICNTTIEILPEESEPYNFQCIGEITVRLGEEAQNSGVEEIATSEFIISDTSNLDFELTNQQFTCDDIGTNPLTIRATNRETGESYSCEVDVTVIDVGAPLIICPAQTITTNLPEEGYKVPNFFENRISDNCDNIEDLDLIQDIPEGTILDSAGTYTINLTATDSYDNEETCRITLILEEDNPNAPEIECVTHELFLDENGQAVLEANSVYNGERTDLELSVSPENFDCSNLGENTVILTATDPDTGLSDTCVTEVMISDDILPVANCVAPGREFRLQNGSVTISPSAIDLNSEDNCEITRTLSEDTFTIPGTKNIILYVEDAAGNTDQCTTTIEILPEDTNRVYRCIEEEDISDIRLDEDCELNIPEYTRLIETENFNPAITQTYEALTEGTYLITVEIRDDDTDEFVGECEFSVNIVDLIPPGISCPNDQIENFDPDTGFEVPNYENMAGISDNCGEVSFRQEPAAGEIIYDNTTVNLFVEDEGGLEASCSFELELTEADVLNISCLIDKNVNPDDNCSFWLPDYTSNADVNFPGANITQTPPVGTILTESTQIKLTASLNGETDECYFMVNLVDDQDPVANCVSGYVVNLDNNGTASINPEDLNNNSTDNCGIVSMALSQVDFTTADIGDVPITLTVRDDAGNIDSCETTVEVRGEASGEFECRENIEVFLDENGQANLNIQELYTGNASGLNLEASRLNFTCEDLGAAFIQLDYSGDETGSCTINVDVRDELPPEINTNLVELTLDIEGFAYLEESDISAEDSCSEELIYRSSKSVFTCKDVGMNSVNVEVEDINGNRSDKNIQVRISGEGCDLPEPGENEYLFLYPNPNNGIFTIATPEGMFIEQVRVFDSRGRYIMQQDYNANARFYRMTIQGVEESVYTLQIFTNEGVIVKRAIIKR